MKRAKFSTHLLDSALTEKRKRNEKRRRDILDTIFSTLNSLSKDVRFDRAFIFGSVTRTGRFNSFSDIDIGFLGLHDKDVIKSATFISRKVGLNCDVLQLEGHRLAEKIMTEGIKWEKKR